VWEHTLDFHPEVAYVIPEIALSRELATRRTADVLLLHVRPFTT